MTSTQTGKVIGFFGDSGSGKTTLIERLIGRFQRDGLRVAAIKHAHHGFDIDRPGKDSYRFRAAGATQVLIASNRRWVLMSEEMGDEAPDSTRESPLTRLLSRFDPCDLVLVEGYRGQAGIPFIQVRRTQNAKAGADASPAERAEPAAGVVAVASDELLPAAMRGGIPHLDLNNIEAIARFIAAELKLR